MSPQIRPYQSADFNSLLEILQENTPNYFAPEEEKDLIHYLQNELEDYFVIEVDNKICGAGGINYKVNTAIISWDFITPKMHRQGLGRLLLTHRLKHIQVQGIEKTIVRTSQFTYQFYAKSGFKLLEVTKDFWAKGYDMYFMQLH